jgi:hypothetical protein
MILGATTVKAPVEEELTITRALSVLLVRMYTCIGRSKSFHYQSPPLLWIALLWLPEMADDALPPSWVTQCGLDCSHHLAVVLYAAETTENPCPCTELKSRIETIT